MSVRAPVERPLGAGALAERFGGGGREGAAGIEHLPEQDFERFVGAFESAYARMP